MKIKNKHLGKSYMKHLDTSPVSFSFNDFPNFGYLSSSYSSPLYSTLSNYGIGFQQMPVGLGYGVGSGPLKKGDIISGDQLTFYDPLNPYNNNTVSLSGLVNGGINSGLTSLGVGVGANGLVNGAINTVKIYSNSELTVNIVGTEADCTKIVKILDKMYSDHKAEIATL